MNIRLPLLIFISFALCSCSKPHVDPGVVNTITGRFYDSANNEPYPNITVKLGEYELKQPFLGRASEQLIGYADATQTDAAGHYKLSFTSNGDGRNYFIEFSGIPNNLYVTPTTPGVPRNGYWFQIKGTGQPAVYDFDISKHYYMQLRVVVHDNPYPPLNVFSGNDHFQLGATDDIIHGTNNDTTEYIPIAKNTGGFKLYFTIYNPTNQTYYRDTDIWLNPLVNRDTIQGGVYNIYPSTFK